jgi:tetratricopeptide (TPR) repeat protein
LRLGTKLPEMGRRLLGAEHPQTMVSMHNPAVTYENLGRLTEALKMYEECLEIRKNVFEPEHSDTLTSMNGLAVTYDKFGRWTEAVEILEGFLHIGKRVRGPDTLTSTSVSKNGLDGLDGLIRPTPIPDYSVHSMKGLVDIVQAIFWTYGRTDG